MFEWLMEEFQNAEFWTSIAFLVVLAVVLRPLMQYLDKWGAGQAELVKKNMDEARSVRDKAEALLKHYVDISVDKEVERQRLLDEAEQEIAFFERETKTRTADRIAHKKQEMALRLKTIEENGRQDIKNKLLGLVIRSAKRDLQALQTQGLLQENMDITMQRVFDALDENEAVLQK